MAEITSTLFLLERTFSLLSHSLKGVSCPISTMRKLLNSLVQLLSCVAVFMRPENATVLASTRIDGLGCFSTSHFNMTNLQHFGFAETFLSTYPVSFRRKKLFGSSFRKFMDSLSIYQKNYYVLISPMFKFYCFNHRVLITLFYLLYFYRLS